MKMKVTKVVHFLIIVVLGSYLLSACGSTNEKMIETTLVNEQVEKQENLAESEDVVIHTAPEENADEQEVMEPTRVSAEISTHEEIDEESSGLDVPPLKTGLEATDPAIVNLSSSGLQLVEFFAFW